MEREKRYPNVLLENAPEVGDYSTTFSKLQVRTQRRPDGFWDAPIERKLAALHDLRTFYIPTGQHVLLAQEVFRLIRAGLTMRDPQESRVMRFLHRAGENVSRFNRLATALTVEREPIGNGGALGYTVMGPSGAGKTSLLDRICKNLPSEPLPINSIAGKPCKLRHVIVIRIQCPSSGTTLGFCHACLRAIDSALGDTHYLELALRKHLATAACEALVIAVFSTVFVSLVVVDDIQYLLAVPKYATTLLQFMCNFMETTGIPVLTVGTYKAWGVLSGKAELSSKLSSEGDALLEAMPLGPEWVKHCRLIWKLRITNPEMDTMPDWFATRTHFLACGIPRILRILARSYFSDLARGRFESPSAQTLTLSSERSLRRLARLLYVLRRAGADDKLSDEERTEFAHYLPPEEKVPSIEDQEKHLAELAKRKAEERKRAAEAEASGTEDVKDGEVSV